MTSATSGTPGTSGSSAEVEQVRAVLLDDAALVRAVASGRRQGRPARWRRAELRYVDLKAGRRLQVTTYDDTQAHTANHVVGADAATEVDALLAEPFTSWRLETRERVLALQVSRKGRAVLHRQERTEPVEPERDHDRAKDRLLPADDPVLRALGISDAEGRVKPSRQAKYRQVEELVRQLDTAVDDALAGGRLRRPTPEHPLRVVDLGCGNAYLTFAAHAYLTRRGLPVRLTGVDVKEQSREHNTELAQRLGVADELEFVTAGIDDVELDERPDVVLALHACDTATDDALARAVEWQAPLVLAAPCCHHDISAQLRRSPAPSAYASLVRDGILRERFADTLTDALRASLMRLAGYRVEVVEFVESQHTPRNSLLRAVRTAALPDQAAQDEYDALVGDWALRPRLAELLGRRL